MSSAAADRGDEQNDRHGVDRPVFVMGTGRSGLTPLMHMLAYHPAFAWPSQYHGKYPAKPGVAKLARIVDWPLVRSSRMKFWRYVPVHEESYPFWRRLFYGFAEPFRDLEAGDVSPYTRSRFEEAISTLVRYQGKTRFICEYSGWSRIAFFKEIFPDAQFIHIVRDGRAVANSLTHVGWWTGWRGIHNWRWGVPPADLLEKLEKYEHSFLAFAAIHWTILVRNIREKSAGLSETDLKVVRYEELVKHPAATAQDCAEFAGLDRDHPRFLAHFKTVKIVDANSKKFRIPSWKSNMTPAQIDMIDDIAGAELEHFGYTRVAATKAV